MKYIEPVSTSLVTLAPPPITGQNLRKITMSMKNDEVGTKFSTQTDASLDDLPWWEESDEEPLLRSERLCQREKNVDYHNGFDLGPGDHNSALSGSSSEANGDPYMNMEPIFDHKVREAQDQRTSEIGEAVYPVWRSKNPSTKGTWEPSHQGSRRRLVKYIDKRSLWYHWTCQTHS